MPPIKQHKLNEVANFIYETGILSKTPRSGLWFLGTGRQTVAEHTLRAAMIGYALAKLTPQADLKKIVLLCLFHDLGEGRTSDLNYVHQRYGRLAEAEAIKDISHSVFFGPEIAKYYHEMEERQSLESKLAKDADILEWLTTLREEEVKGNTKAHSWAVIAFKRLKTPIGKKIGRLIMTTHPDTWFFNEHDEWFVHRRKKDRRWKTKHAKK